jgi:YVTN family beta-propeller protein
MRVIRPSGIRAQLPVSLLAVVLAACQPTAPGTSEPSGAGALGSPTPTLGVAYPRPTAFAPSAEPTATFGATSAPIGSPTAAPPAGGVYAATLGGLSDAMADIPARVYVPNERGGKVVVIDPATFEIVDRIEVGTYPEHVSPSWDGQLLYVNNMNSDSMSVIDPRTGRVTDEVSVPFPYNLYFTPDGTRAIVVQDMVKGAPEDENGLRFLTNPGFGELGFVPIPWAGADHLDFSADGRFLYLSCEYSGRVAVVDVERMRVTAEIVVGGFPTDVRLAPDGRHVFVANQLLHNLTVIDTTTNKVVEVVKLQKGSHGLALGREATVLFVTNRLAGSVSVVDVATWAVIDTWEVGGSPDMIAVSADGKQLWISNRWDRSVAVLDSATGRVLKRIETGAYPHGLAFWPLPGRFSLGHNGNMR